MMPKNLPPKESTLFKNILVFFFCSFVCFLCFVKFANLLFFFAIFFFFGLSQRHYEQKQYKRCLRMADTILKKFPDHGGMKNILIR